MIMRLSTVLWFLTAGSAATAAVILDNDFYNKSKLMFTRQHDVINIYYDMSCTGNMFFIEADVANGMTTFKGLYAATRLDGDTFTLVKKVLDDGKDITCDGRTVYFAATNGIYTYNDKEVKSEKFGTVTEDIRCIAKVKGSDIIFILNENNQLFKVTQNGTRKIEVTSVVDANEIVLDRANNLYYYSSDKKPWVLIGDVARKINGLPENPSYIKFVKPSKSFRHEVLVFIDNELYKISSKGTSIKLAYDIVDRPSALSVDAIFVVWFSHGKKIYVIPFYDTFDW